MSFVGFKHPTNEQLANGRQWCVAGGWAACPQLAGDQDVWIFTGESCCMGPDIETRLEWTRAARVELLKMFPAIRAEQDAADINLDHYGDLGFFVVKVGTLDRRHIMVTDAEDIMDLLSSFDISTHQSAIDSNMQFIQGENWTPITEPPNAMRQTETTDARMKKITERYCKLWAEPIATVDPFLDFPYFDASN